MVRESWVQDYQDAKQLAQEIMELISERNSMQRQGGIGGSAKNQSSIRVKLQELSQRIKALKSDLIKASRSNLVTRHESDRRQNQIDDLVSRERQLNEAFKPSSSQLTSGRVGLLNEGFDVERGDHSGSSSRPMNQDITPETYRQMQSQIIEEQDEGLNALHDVISRQKRMGQAIGDEIDYHNEIIDDLTGHVDNTEKKLVSAESHVRKVTKKAGSCALIVIVVLLFIAIIVVAAIPKSL